MILYTITTTFSYSNDSISCCRVEGLNYAQKQVKSDKKCSKDYFYNFRFYIDKKLDVNLPDYVRKLFLSNSTP